MLLQHLDSQPVAICSFLKALGAAIFWSSSCEVLPLAWHVFFKHHSANFLKTDGTTLRVDNFASSMYTFFSQTLQGFL